MGRGRIPRGEGGRWEGEWDREGGSGEGNGRRGEKRRGARERGMGRVEDGKRKIKSKEERYGGKEVEGNSGRRESVFPSLLIFQ